MDQQERDKILTASRNLELREITPEPWFDPYSDMTTEEKSKLIIELMSSQKSDRERINSLMDKLDRMAESQLAANEASTLLRGQLSELMNLLKDKEDAYRLLQSEKEALAEQLKVNRKTMYGSKSQKGISKKKDNKRSKEEDKDHFDGSPESISQDDEQSGENCPQAQSPSSPAKEIRMYRQGVEYRTMKAGKSVSHRSDMGKLPKEAQVLKVFFKYSYEQISEILEHQYQVVRYKMPDGKIYEGYFPKSGEPEIIDKVPGTHASSNFLAYLAFNKYVLDTPFYREILRIMDEKMRVCRMTLSNWLAKGGTYMAELVKVLKNMCLEKDSVINCDETWCRVKINDTYRKKYIWCLVNKEAKIAIYCYGEGSRSRDALRLILGNAQVKSLQSDGYNVYMYLDNELIDVEHICCMAHARAKFKYALEQGGDKDAEYFLKCIGELYKLEAEYEHGKLSAEQIGLLRQKLKTKEIVIRLRSKLDAMLSENHSPRGELMEKAIRYLDTFWTQLFAYLKDGRYSIDNSIAERFIRPLAGERKNSLFFGSDRMANVSAAYHTIISTCKMHGISALEFFKSFFHEIMLGRRDYENLLPMTIGIKPNKI